MPYIEEIVRPDIYDKETNTINVSNVKCGGDIQYAIAEMVNYNLNQIKKEKGEVRYSDVEKMMGCLNGANLEFYLEVVKVYENIVKEKNGKVYDNYFL